MPLKEAMSGKVINRKDLSGFKNLTDLKKKAKPKEDDHQLSRWFFKVK